MKKKKIRINIILECLNCKNNLNNKGISRYITSKNYRNTTKVLSLYKYCKFCKKHTLYTEL